MPTIHIEAGFRFHIYAQDHAPPHIHVEKAGSAAKFLLEPVRVVRNDGFNARDLSRIELVIRRHSIVFEDAWHGHFGTTRPGPAVS